MATHLEDISCESASTQQHSTNFHADCLKKLCRICSKRLQSVKQKYDKSRKVREVKKHQVSIKDAYGIDVSNDNCETTHPKFFCHSGMMGIYNLKRNPNSQELALKKLKFQSINDRWSVFNQSSPVSDCFACAMCTEQAKGGKIPEIISVERNLLDDNTGFTDMNNTSEQSQTDSKENGVIGPVRCSEVCSSPRQPLKDTQTAPQSPMLQSQTGDSCQTPKESKYASHVTLDSPRQPLRDIHNQSQTPPNCQTSKRSENASPMTMDEFLQSPEPNDYDDKVSCNKKASKKTTHQGQHTWKSK